MKFLAPPKIPTLSRRRLMQVGGVSALLAGFGPRLALAAPATDQRFVFIALRGGMDGLAALPPLGDPDLLSARAALVPGAEDDGVPLDVDGFFALHPALTALQASYRAKDLAIAPAVGLASPNRSHFDAQNVLETGAGRPDGSNTGWINRMLAALPGGGDDLGIAIDQTVPLALIGPARTSAWAPSRSELPGDTVFSFMTRLYAHEPMFLEALEEGLAAQDLADEALDGQNGNSPEALAQAAAAFLVEPDGARVAVLELADWDTHSNQGATEGRVARAFGDLNATIAALVEGLAPVWDRTVILAATEFGRNVAMNGTRGTDHGIASTAIMLGGAVSGGRIVGTWPGLREQDLVDGRDLAATVEFRSLAKAVAMDHFGLPSSVVEREIFPDSRDAPPLARLLV